MDVIVAVGRRAKAEAAIVTAALRERRDPVAWQVAGVVDGFVTGEETAVLNALAGKPAKPSVKPPYPYERGLGGAPTLVQNAETLAHVGLHRAFRRAVVSVLRHGGRAGNRSRHRLGRRRAAGGV